MCLGNFKGLLICNIDISGVADPLILPPGYRSSVGGKRNRKQYPPLNLGWNGKTFLDLVELHIKSNFAPFRDCDQLLDVIESVDRLQVLKLHFIKCEWSAPCSPRDIHLSHLLHISLTGGNKLMLLLPSLCYSKDTAESFLIDPVPLLEHVVMGSALPAL